MRVAASALIAVLLLGCGSAAGPGKKPKSEPSKEPTAKKPQLERSVETGAITIEARSEKRLPLWTARAKEATLNVFTNDNVAGTLRTVEGEIFNEEGELANRFTAAEADADRAKKSLRVKGQVILMNEEGTSKVSADRLDWMQDINLIQLIGNIWVKSETLRAGPMAVLWARPDLNEIGTPNMMKKGIDLKTLYAALALSPAVAMADIEWKTPDDHIQLKGMKSWKLKRATETKWTVTGQGAPFTAILEKQGLTLRGRSLDSTLEKGKSGWYASTADVAGDVSAKLDRDGATFTSSGLLFSGDEDSGTLKSLGKFTYSDDNGISFDGGKLDAKLLLGPGTGGLTKAVASNFANIKRTQAGEVLTGSCGTLTYDVVGELATLTMNGAAELTRSADGATIMLKSANASATLKPEAKNGDGLTKAEMKGSVTMTYAKTVDGKKTTIDSSADSLIYDAVARKITLWGNVKANGTGDAMTGSMTGDKVVVTLNEKGEVIEIEAEAEAGTARIKGR